MTTLTLIRNETAKAFDVTVLELISPRRARCVARPRMAAYYLSKDMTAFSLPAIGRFYNRDHTTVMHGIGRAEELIGTDMTYSKTVAAIRCRCGSRADIDDMVMIETTLAKLRDGLYRAAEINPVRLSKELTAMVERLSGGAAQ